MIIDYDKTVLGHFFTSISVDFLILREDDIIILSHKTTKQTYNKTRLHLFRMFKLH